MRLELNETSELLNESDGIYHLAEMIPQACINQCSSSGDQYHVVKSWVKILRLSIPREHCIKEIKEYGAWDDGELEDSLDLELNIKYLWLAAGYGG